MRTGDCTIQSEICMRKVKTECESAQAYIVHMSEKGTESIFCSVLRSGIPLHGECDREGCNFRPVRFPDSRGWNKWWKNSVDESFPNGFFPNGISAYLEKGSIFRKIGAQIVKSDLKDLLRQIFCLPVVYPLQYRYLTYPSKKCVRE